MIVFDLRCEDAGHVFEAWFGSTGDYEDQHGRGLVACPICESKQISRAVTAARIGAKSNHHGGNDGAIAVASGGESARMKVLLAKVAKAQAQMLEKSEHVGPRFVDEARAIHAGDSEVRAIHGEASDGDARSLIEEGIEIAPLPLPVRDPKAAN